MKTNASERVRRHCAALRKAGLRPVRIWVPDTRRAGFAEKCRRQSLSLRNDAHERKIADWLEAAGDLKFGGGQYRRRQTKRVWAETCLEVMPEPKMMQSDQCIQCTHYRMGKQCDAFPEAIPDAIFHGEFDHRNTWPGDNGIRFESMFATGLAGSN